MLTETTKKRMIQELKQAFKQIGAKLEKSPCFYRGCRLWYDCKTCDGFKKDCTARLPEAIFKNKDGTWRKDVY